MTTRKIRECAINDRRGRGEGLFRWGVCRSFNLFFQHVEGELLKKYLGNSGRLFPFAWIDVSFDPCRWLGARGRKAQRKLHLLMIFFRYLANWSDWTQKLAGLKFRDWRPCRPKAIDNFSHNRFVDRQLFGKSIISKFQSQKLAGLKFRDLKVWSFVIDGRVGPKPSSKISATIDLWIVNYLVSELFSNFNIIKLFKEVTVKRICGYAAGRIQVIFCSISNTQSQICYRNGFEVKSKVVSKRIQVQN